MINAQTTQFAAWLRENKRAARSVTAYVADVERYIAWCEREYQQSFTVDMLNRSDLIDYQVDCRKKIGLKAATWNRYLASLTIYGAYLMERGELPYNPADCLSRAESQKLAPKSLTKPDYRRLRLAVYEAVRTANTAPAKWQALRNAAIITLLADAGLREGEVVHLRPQDLVLSERKGRVIILNAKGDKDRVVPLDFDSVTTLKSWLAVRASTGAPELFHGKRHDALQERGIQKIVGKLAADAKIEHITPHQLRHTAAYRWRKSGATLEQIAELLGHSSIEITRRYTLPHYSDLEDLVELA